MLSGAAARRASAFTAFIVGDPGRNGDDKDEGDGDGGSGHGREDDSDQSSDIGTAGKVLYLAHQAFVSH